MIKKWGVAVASIALLALAGCSDSSSQPTTPRDDDWMYGHVFLYGGDE